MAWKFHGISWVHFRFCFYFCLEPTVRKDTSMRTTFVTVMVRDILEVTWSRICSKFLINSCEEHWQQPFERHPTVENLSFPKKSEPVLQRTLHQNRWYFIYFWKRFFFSQTNIFFKFSPALISILDSFRHNFFTFLFYVLIIDIIHIFKFIQ